jgi:large subunit ribosomal protein L25
MEFTSLKTTSRVLGAGRETNRLRKSGQVPAVYYGKGLGICKHQCQCY